MGLQVFSQVPIHFLNVRLQLAQSDVTLVRYIFFCSTGLVKYNKYSAVCCIKAGLERLKFFFFDKLLGC